MLSELNRSHETVLLRLMGRDRVLRDALADVQKLPEHAWERVFVARVILRLGRDLARMLGEDALWEMLMRSWRGSRKRRRRK